MPRRPAVATQAVVLAAGNGDRFHHASGSSKLVHPIRGVPLIVHTLRALRSAGVLTAHIVVGYRGSDVRAAAVADAPADLALLFHENRAWDLENGLSALAARRATGDAPFALVMADHIFDPSILHALRFTDRRQGETLLAIDRRLDDGGRVAEATKVQTHAGAIVAIGKHLERFDALDTGIFVTDTSLFDALEQSCRAGDSTLTAGVRRLAAAERVRGVDISAAVWFDIDTPADVWIAEGAESFAGWQ